MDPELAAVESALNTLALAQTEAAFERLLTRLLPALLTALSTPSAAAKAKIIDALQHINVRHRANPSLKLPFSAILSAAVAPDAVVLTENVSIQGGYLSKAFHSLDDKASAYPELLENAHKVKQSRNRDAVLKLALESLAVAFEGAKSGTDSLWPRVQHCSVDAIAAFFEFALLSLRGRVENVQDKPLLAIVRLCVEYASDDHPERSVKVFPHFLMAAGSKRNALATAGQDALRRMPTCDQLAEYDPTISNLLFQLFVDRLAEINQKLLILQRAILKMSLCASCFPEVFDVMEETLLMPGMPQRAKALGMQFISFVISNAEEGLLEEHAHPFFEIIHRLINEKVAEKLLPSDVRAFGYIAMSEMIIKCPELMKRDDVTFEMFFRAAIDKYLSDNIRTAAAQALVALTRVVQLNAADMKDERTKVLGIMYDVLQIEDSTGDAARAAVVQWANECFTFDDCHARLIDIIAIGDRKQTVSQAAAIGLAPKVKTKKDKVVYPNFMDMVQTYDNYKSDSLRPKSVAAYMQFMLATLKHVVLTASQKHVLTTQLLDGFFQTNPMYRDALSKLLEHAHSILLSNASITDRTLLRASLSLLILAAKTKALKSTVAQKYVSRIEELISLATVKTTSGDSASVNAIAYIVSTASECLIDDKLNELVQKVSAGLEPDPNGVVSGRSGEDTRVCKLLTLGHILSRSRFRADVTWDQSETSPLSQACLHVSRRQLQPIDSSTSVRVAACLAIADMASGGILPMKESSRANTVSSMAGLLKKSSTDAKLAQAACEALGRICVGEPRVSFIQITVDALLTVCKERKEEDVRFVAAENLVRCTTAFDAPLPINQESLGIGKGSSEAFENEELLSLLQMKTEGYVIREIIQDEDSVKQSMLNDVIAKTMALAYDERPITRAGGCVALFNFLKLLGSGEAEKDKSDRELVFSSSVDKERHQALQQELAKLLPKLQQAFTSLLADRSDFVQQLASCGVALVYDMSSPAMQQDLVSTLVRSLTAGKTKAATVVPGDQGAILDLGGGIDVKESTAGTRFSTYKELCTLAQDIGQPELVYKFMDLAGHAALWNSRKGAALAGSALLGTELAAEQLRPHVKNLLPRLYVYCHDPSEGIRVSMASVLTAVVKAAGFGSIAEAITKNYASVTQYCLNSMTSRQWRSRQAACGALRDSLVSRSWQEVKDLISDFWYFTLRALDDIKESVRKAAGGTGRALSELSIYLCNPAQVSVEVAQDAIGVILPCIMPAFTHREPEVRLLATKTLSELIRIGGSALKPSVPDLVSNLLEAASELEPQFLNYAQFHVDSPEELQDLRAKAAATSESPLIDSLERLSTLVDESNITQLIPVLTRLARVGVGVPTRAATARFFGTLLRSRATIIESFTPKLLRSAASAADMDRNQALRAAWCTAAGAAASLSSVSVVAEFVGQIVRLAHSEDAFERSLASSLALGLWQRSPETGRQHATALLPLAYVGQNESDEAAKPADKNWKTVWEEGAPSSEAAMRLYASEITDLCIQRLATSTQYRVKRSSAAALAALADGAGGHMKLGVLRKGLEGLLEALNGPVWDGKAAVVEAIGRLAGAKMDGLWKEIGGEEVVKRLLEECKRGRREYRMAAVVATGCVAERCRNDWDCFETVRIGVEQYWEVIGKTEASEDGDAMVWDAASDANAVDARNRARKAGRQLCIASLECIEKAYPEDGSDKQKAHFGTLLRITENVMTGDWDVRLAALQAMRLVCERTAKSVVADNAKAVVNLAGIGIKDMKYASLRRAGLSLLMSFNESDRQNVVRFIDDELRLAILKCRESDGYFEVQADAKKACSMLAIL